MTRPTRTDRTHSAAEAQRRVRTAVRDAGLRPHGAIAGASPGPKVDVRLGACGARLLPPPRCWALAAGRVSPRATRHPPRVAVLRRAARPGRPRSNRPTAARACRAQQEPSGLRTAAQWRRAHPLSRSLSRLRRFAHGPPHETLAWKKKKLGLAASCVAMGKATTSASPRASTPV